MIEQRATLPRAMILAMDELSDAREWAAEFELLYERHYRDVFRYCLALLREVEDAEDVTGEVFERGFRAWRSGHGPAGTPLPWLLLIARRIVIDRSRRRKLVSWLPLTRSAATASDGTADVDRLEFWLWFDRLATVLTPRQREVLLLRYQHDLPIDQIGLVMGISEPGARSLISRALAILREHPELIR
jgi:RNA polymerase sigma-70 factor (ECF subfamily)